ncbi:MAG TPA: hypothetical protein PLO28_07085 [bacterium]|nr:hypothetical protein [bacterium]
MRAGIRCCMPLLLMFAFGFSAASAQLSIQSTRTMDLVYFGKVHEFIVPHLSRCYLNSRTFESRLFNYSSQEKTTVFLQDFGDYGNAGAISVPRNFIRMELAPHNYVYETTPANERMNWLMNHETVHVITTDQPAHSDRLFRALFMGKVQDAADDPASLLYAYLTTPRLLTPRWYLEGIAVFMETWLAGGLGRAQGAYDEMVFRAMVCDRAPFYNVVGLEAEGTAIDFQVGANSYLYGARFISYLGYQYGPEKVLEWYRRDDDSKRYFAAQFKKVFGTSLAAEWSRWVGWEQHWQQANLDSLHRNPVTPFRPISRRALGSVSRGFYDPARNKLYTAVLYPGQVASIAALDLANGELKPICEVKGPTLYSVTSLAWNPAAGALFYTSDNQRWRDLNIVDIRTGHSRRLIKDGRIGDLAYNRTDSTLWGVRHFNGFSTLVTIPYPWHEWKQVRSFPYGQDVFDLDLSPDGSTLTASLVEISGRQKLIRIATARPDTFAVVFDFENSLPQSFVFSPDGQYSYGSSYYSGVSNIYRYNWAKEDMEILSNAETGFFQPVPLPEDSLLVMRYSGRGFIPGKIAIAVPEQVSAVTFLGAALVKKYPVVRSWVIGSPARITPDSLIRPIGPYHPLGHLRLGSAYPVVQGYKESAAAGWRANFVDLIGAAGVTLSALYSPDQRLPQKERLHLGMELHWWQWSLSAGLNDADFYDLFGPTKTSRKGYNLQAEYSKNLIYDKPRTLDLNLSVKHYGGMDRLPDYQNIAATYDRMSTAKIALDYQYVRKSLGAVDDEKGIRLRAFSSASLVNGKLYPRIYGHLDYGIPIAIGHSSIWLRASAGRSFGGAENPFANFFFGGFGNNWVDHGTEKRYREYYSLPGLELNALGGRGYGKAMIEWNLPPLRFRSLGVTSLYCRWLRPALFASAILTNPEMAKGGPASAALGVRRSLANLGAQADFRLVSLSRFESTLSLGYGVAFEGGQRNKEFMISLKIL